MRWVECTENTMNHEGTAPELFRPGAEDLRRIDAEVAEVSDLQRRIRERHPDLKCLDRAAHQYQIAGSKVVLRVASQLPEGFAGVGLFVPGAEHFGVGRVSTSLNTPHVETIPDFLGLRASFVTATTQQQVDFIAVSSPALPFDNRHDVMRFLRATADAAGPSPIVPSPLAAGEVLMRESLTKSMGFAKTERTLKLIAQQSERTASSGTAYQSYWTGVVEINGTLGKFMLVPLTSANCFCPMHPGERYLTRDWARRQSSGDIAFRLHWISYLDERRTSLEHFTQSWSEAHKRSVGRLIFPRIDATTKDARLWAALAGEMGSNPGNWICDAHDSVREPSTEFGLARKAAYERSTRGRDALALDAYRTALQTGRIGDDLAAELTRRVERKRQLRHIDQAPKCFLG
jgi:hypothetical protein